MPELRETPMPWGEAYYSHDGADGGIGIWHQPRGEPHCPPSLSLWDPIWEVSVIVCCLLASETNGTNAPGPGGNHAHCRFSPVDDPQNDQIRSDDQRFLTEVDLHVLYMHGLCAMSNLDM